MKLCAAFLLGAALAPAAAGSPNGRPRVIITNAGVESIAMDGPLLAYDVSGREGGCNRLYVWNVVTGSTAHVSGRQTCDADGSSTGLGVREIAVAGRRLALIVNDGGNTESDDTLYTASFPKPKERQLAFTRRTGEVDGTLNGGWIGGLVGDGGLLAVSTWTTKNEEITRGTLRTIGAGGLKTIATGPGTAVAASASRNRIAVRRDDGVVAIYSRTGALLKTITAAARSASLDGNRLVVLSGKHLVVYDATSGALLHTWPGRPNGTMLDVEGGIAVYTIQCRFVDECGGRAYAVRLSDGKSTLFVRPNEDLVGLALEPAGLAYALKGRVVFRPMQQVRAALG